MSLSEICNTIQSGDVKNALRIIDTSPDTATSHVILLKLNSICYKNIPELSAPGVAQDVFKLADLLCRAISNTDDDFPKIVIPLFHITNYLLKFDPLLARDICKYFFQVDAARARRKTTIKKDEQAVYYNLVHIFSSKLLDRLDRLEISSGADSVESWMEFTFQLSRLRTNDSLKMPLQIFYSILLTRTGNRRNEYLTLCFSKLRKWLAILVESKEGSSIDIVDSFVGLVQLVVSLVPDVKDLIIYVERIVDCISKIQVWCPQGHDTMVILESALLLCQALENQKCTPASASTANYQLNRLTSTVVKQPRKMHPVFSVVQNLMYKSRLNFISSKDSFKSTVKDIYSLLLSLSEHSNCSNDPDLKSSKRQLEIVYIAFTILNGFSASKETLEEVFPGVKRFVKLFCKTAACTDQKSTHFSAGVAELLNVVNAYKRAELTVESAQICQYVFTTFLEMDPEFISENPYFKNYIEVWLKSWAASCAKNTYGIAAQVSLVIFAQCHPKYTIDAMKAWVSLKKLKAMEVKMHSTVLDVLNVNNQEIEQKYPNLKVVNFDIGRLLLGEAYAYSKSRDLYGEPVLNVYKAAAKASKKNYIALANILCCTVDAFTFDVNDKKHNATLEASVSNMIAHLQKVERDVELPSERAALFCSLGNLYYYKARLERQHIRQKAEAEISEENSDLKIPVIRLGEKDALDMTEIVAVGSSLKMSNSKLLDILEKAMEFWGKCANSLEPSSLLTPTLSAIKGAGYLFRLYGYKELESSCWNQLFRIASKMGSLKHQFLAAGELLAVQRTVDPTIINCVENLKFDRKCYACLTYRVNFAKNMLLQGQVDEFRQAVDKIDIPSVLCFFLVNAHYKFIRALFNLSHPTVVNTDTSLSLVQLTALFENLMYLIVHNQWETHNEATVVQLLVLETSYLLSTVNSDLKYVRPARCYMKCGLPLSKKLALPARVCQAMTLGCWVDLLTWNVTESEINAQEVESLLELGVLKLGDRQTVCSPRRDSGLKVVPHFLSKKNCKCQSCLVTDYPFLVLDAISNRVLVLIGNDGHREAHQVIGVGMKILEFIKEKEAASQTLPSLLSCSVARFYYVVASANALWLKHEEAIRYAAVAARALDSATMKNFGLDISIKRLILGVRWTQSYKRPVKPKPISRRFGSGATISSAVTPESIQKPGTVVLKNPKLAEKGFYNMSESEKLSRKILYSKEEIKEGCGVEELEGISKLSVSPSPKFAKKNGKSKAYRTCLHVPNATYIEGKNENLGNSNTPKTGVSDVPNFAQKMDQSSKTRPKTAKTDLFFKAIYNQLSAGGAQTPERIDNSSTNDVLYTPPNPVASSTKKPRTEKKPILPKANILGTPCMASLAKIGIGVKTPAVKVFYDPDGLESTAKKPKSKVSVKKPKRLATKGLANDKSGTPKATPARAAKDKSALDEDSSDEIEFVSAQFKRLLAQKERFDDEGKFKKPAGTSKNSHVEEGNASTQKSEVASMINVNQDDTGSTDSFHSTLTHFDDTWDSLPSMKKQLVTYSKKDCQTNQVSTDVKSELSDSHFSLCSNDALGNSTAKRKPATRFSRTTSTLEEKSRELAGALAPDKKLLQGSGLVLEDCSKPNAAEEFDSSGLVTAPFKKVLTNMTKTAKPIIEKTITDVTDDESDLPVPAAGRLEVTQKEAVDELESSEVMIAPTKTQKARRAIFDDTADINEAECLPEAATTSGKHAYPEPSKSRKPRRALVAEPQHMSDEFESIPISLSIQKPRRPIVYASTIVNDSHQPEQLVSPFRKVIGHSVPRSRKLFDETTVDLTDEAASCDTAAASVVEQETLIGEIKPKSGKNVETTHMILKDTVNESDLEASMIVTTFRKLAISGKKGVASKGKPVINDETLDEEEVQEMNTRESKKVVPVQRKAINNKAKLGTASSIRKTTKHNLNGTFDWEEEDKDRQNSEATHSPAQKKAVNGSLVKTKNHSSSVLKSAVPVAIGVDEFGGKKTAAGENTKKHPNSNPKGVASKQPTKVALKSATLSSTRQAVESEMLPSTSSSAAKGATSRAVAPRESKVAEKPARRIRAIPKELKSGLSEQSSETMKGISLKPSAVKVDQQDNERSLSTSPNFVDGAVEATSKEGSSKAVGLATSPTIARYVGARPKRVTRATPKEPQPRKPNLSAKTSKSSKTSSLTVPSSNFARKSPDHENIDPTSTTTSPTDSSIIESSFLEPSAEMKLPLAPRSLADEMNKLGVSSEPVKRPDKINPVKVTRRNVKK